MEKESNKEFIRETIAKIFNYLENEYLYIPTFKVDDNSNVFIEDYQVEYLNEELKREVCITYTKGKVYEDIIYTFHARIVRIPYSGYEDFFGLNIYLKSIGQDYNTSLKNYFNTKDAETILLNISESLQTYALKIIIGEEWLDKYYPVKD